MRSYIFLFIAFAAFSCKSRVFELDRHIPGNTWDVKNVQAFDVPVADTLSPCDVSVNLRHNGNYAYSNIFLFITILSPEGNSVKDTLQIQLADNAGKWYGSSALGDIYYIRKMYRPNILSLIHI